MWLLIITSLIVIWVASLCKMFHISSSSSTKPDFLSRGGVSDRRNVLLVVAHPDDESMFFSPTISYLIARGHNLHILCLSVGNADGLGNIRKEELYKACEVLKVPHQQVKVLDHQELQDGFGKAWSHSLVSEIIEEEILTNGINAIITFDNYGVSGHCNHRDVHHAVRKLLHDTSRRDIEAWELVSTSILRKYSGPVDIWISTLSSSQSSGGSAYCILNEQPRRSFRAMSKHSSQWVCSSLIKSGRERWKLTGSAI
ncbi:N-acetylglucosaminyl-phosphatidylinositol de-N-acetylase isoform X2 [Punica granatum]|uniref:N-acetylglucosaminylphosphatidylinositol deacetylase n=1 Tax=Punica granatum TaxID=22663 RepID=A0A6P8EAM2_PUNGR|nr:N-acetylglucosaminyl-phosphatidylinositol de-N-acetylase isoform X2 [Punica granatum]